VKTLVVEDDAVVRLLLTKFLKERNHEVIACESAEEAMKIFVKEFFPLILLDVFLPGMDGISFCKWLRNQPRGNRHYVLVCTSSQGAGELRNILDAGADDYIAKPYQKDILNVRLTIAEQQVVALMQRRDLEEKLEHLATHDPLTQLLNRSQLGRLIQESIEKSRQGISGALLYIDLDNFKMVNDALGHAAGDRLLIRVASIFREVTRLEDQLVRFGGDEFAILLDRSSFDQARAVAERLRVQMSEFTFQDSGKAFNVGASLGLTMTHPEYSAEQLMAQADAACYTAKSKGRNRVEVYSPAMAEITNLRNDSGWLMKLRDAIREDRFEIWFQPIVEIASGRASHQEALLRLRDDQGLFIEPGAFLPAAARFKMMKEIDEVVLKKVTQYLSLETELHLGVNLSGQSLNQPQLAEDISGLFMAAKIDPSRVILEITETEIISNLNSARNLIKELRGQGFKVALDDFGSGFSSFAYLKNLPADYLKMDGSFIRDLAKEPKSRVFVRVVNEIAHELGMKSVAEFVEDQATYDILRDLGVDHAQGYFVGQPKGRPLQNKE
jgi:diguanylate cyclase (GGDEF)-like protein